MLIWGRGATRGRIGATLHRAGPDAAGMEMADEQAAAASTRPGCAAGSFGHRRAARRPALLSRMTPIRSVERGSAKIGTKLAADFANWLCRITTAHQGIEA